MFRSSNEKKNEDPRSETSEQNAQLTSALLGHPTDKIQKH